MVKEAAARRSTKYTGHGMITSLLAYARSDLLDYTRPSARLEDQDTATMSGVPAERVYNSINDLIFSPGASRLQ